jgi:hypothetical protein
MLQRPDFAGTTTHPHRQKEFAPELLMESYAMSDNPKLGFKIFGASVTAEGALAVAGAVLMFLALLACYRF